MGLRRDCCEGLFVCLEKKAAPFAWHGDQDVDDGQDVEG